MVLLLPGGIEVVILKIRVAAPTHWAAEADFSAQLTPHSDRRCAGKLLIVVRHGRSLAAHLSAPRGYSLQPHLLPQCGHVRPVRLVTGTPGSDPEQVIDLLADVSPVRWALGLPATNPPASTSPQMSHSLSWCGSISPVAALMTPGLFFTVITQLAAEGHRPKRSGTWHPESVRRILARAS